MIRWKYVVPRLSILLAVVAALTWGLDPLIRWALVAGGRAATGADVQVSDIDASLWKLDLDVHDFRLTPPGENSSNLVSCEQMHLDVELGALLKKKLVVRDGAMHGLHIGPTLSLTRASATDDRATANDSQLATRLAEFGSAWSNQLLTTTQKDLERELESIRLARELQVRWPEEYQGLQQRIDQLQARYAIARQLLEGFDRNDPVAAVQRAQQALAEVEQIRLQIEQLQLDVVHLQTKAGLDIEAIGQAKGHDLRKIREKFEVNPIASEDLSCYLLGPELSAHLNSLIGWIQWSRHYLPSKAEPVEPARGRGLTFRFPAAGQLPDLLIRQLHIAGNLELGERLIPFSGTVTGATNQPSLYGAPLEITVTATGELPLTFHAVLNHAHDPPTDHIELVYPEIPQPEIQLGRKDKLAVTLPAGAAHLSATMSLIGDQLSGQLELTRSGADLVAAVGQQLGGQRIERRFQQALNNIARVDATLVLDGTLQRPRALLRSSMTKDLTAAMNEAVRQELAARRDEVLASLERRIDDEISSIDDWIVQQQAVLTNQLQLESGQLDQLSQQLLGQGGSGPDLLGSSQAVSRFLFR